MSASLVGSEMCIRDSPLQFLAPAQGRSRSQLPGAPQGGLPSPLDALNWRCLLYTSDAADDM
eukprot:3316933-Alexandrium_andersonii.AAC.1